jgi:hypothetical protein
MKKQSGLSTVEVEVLEFWENVLPIDLIRPHKRLLPESAKLPKRSASDSEWLGFYESISTPQIRDSVELVSVLSYPILDARDLERIQFTPVHILRRRNNFGIPWG